MGMPTDILGTNVNFDFNRANPNPPASGTFAGYLIPSNFQQLNDIPRDATLWKNTVGQNSEVDNTFAPRFGLAWQMLPNTNRLVLRGGYGMYYSHLTNPRQINMGALQFGGESSRAGVANAAATLANPFPPVPATVTTDTRHIVWGQDPFTPISAINVNALDVNYRVPVTHKYSLNIQSEVVRNFLLEVGYVGGRGLHQTHTRAINQALLVSPSNPIRGITTNTVANVNQRVPILGIPAAANGARFVEASGKTWHNSLQTSLTKRMAKGLQFTAGYTWSKTMDRMGTTSQVNAQGTPGVGNSGSQKANWGKTEQNRDHRFVFSYVYELPNVANQKGIIGRLASGWSVSGVTVRQTGTPLSVLYTNSNNIYGITTDRASLALGCTHDDLVTSGRIQDRLNNYLNRACVATPRVIGDDGRATDFGNLGSGVITGPGQFNTDMSVRKDIPLGSDRNKRMEFRTEFFNLFNTPQFSNPSTNFSASTYGQISSTSVNSRFIQFALKLAF
jgi:hypothetical protein